MYESLIGQYTYKNISFPRNNMRHYFLDAMHIVQILLCSIILGMHVNLINFILIILLVYPVKTIS